MNVNWIGSGMVEEGSFCRAQGLYDYMPHRSELKSCVNRNYPEYRRDGSSFQYSRTFLPVYLDSNFAYSDYRPSPFTPFLWCGSVWSFNPLRPLVLSFWHVGF